MLEEFPEREEQEEDEDANVRSEEARQLIRAPVLHRENFETVEEYDQGKVREPSPWDVSSTSGLEDHGAAVNALSNCGLAKARVCKEDGAPCETLSDGGQVLKPEEYRVGASGNTHVCDEGEGRCDTDAIVRDTILGALE